MVSDDEEDEEDSSKQERSLIKDMDLDAGISLVLPHVADQGRFDDTHVSDQPEEQLGVFSAAKVLADAARIRRGYTSGLLVLLVGLSGENPIFPSPVATKDKGKAVMQESEPPKKIKKREHNREAFDYEAAMRIQEELDESERQRMAQVHQAAQGFTYAEWDDILARVAVDEDLVQQLQAGEKYSEEDLPRKLVELVNQRKKFFAQQRAEAKRNKPMTPTQQKAYMLTYIKNHEGGYSIKKLKSLSFEQLEDKRLKRAGQEGLEEPAKRQKIGEASRSVQEQSDEEPKAGELSQEQLQQLMIIVPKEGMNVEALQTNEKVLKLKNIKKDGYTRFQHQEQYEHDGSEVIRSQEGKRSQDDDKRLCLVDDLKEVLNHIHIKYSTKDDEDWLIAPVTPPRVAAPIIPDTPPLSFATSTPLPIDPIIAYKVGDPSLAVPDVPHPVGQPFFVVVSRDALHHQELAALHVRLDGVESIQTELRRSERAIVRDVGWLGKRDEIIQRRTLSLVRRVDGLIDDRVADSIAISVLHHRMATIEERVQTLVEDEEYVQDVLDVVDTEIAELRDKVDDYPRKQVDTLRVEVD
ncbi:hypothetical protein Tco_1362108 [Tanacetum coccineum]